MKVLSLFDGMSCGRIALERAGVPVTQYLASEIDKYAITVSRANYPDIIQLGDVVTVRAMAEAGVFGHMDMLIGGSPCQGFSFAGKQLAFDDPRSALFFEYVRILRALQRTNPNIRFMLENVRMKKEHLAVITQMLGVEPVFINSALVSAQNRQRFYWCNWSVSQPADRGIMLRDIIESGEVDRDKSFCIDANYYKGGSLKNYLAKSRRQIVLSSGRGEGVKVIAHRGDSYSMNGRIHSIDGKSPTLIANPAGGNRPPLIETGTKIAFQTDEMRLMVKEPSKNGLIFVAGLEKGKRLDDGKNLSRNYREGSRIYSIEGKAAALTSQAKGGAGGHTGLYGDEITYRKLTPIECERLQGVPDNYTAAVSNTQRYKMLGNGWQVDTVEHIFREMTCGL